MINFELTEEEEQMFEEWRKSKPKEGMVAIGGAYTFCFNPTGIGVFKWVKHVDGTTLDLTKDVNW